MVKKLLLRSVISLSIALIISCGKSEESDGDKTVFRYNDASGILTLDPAFSKDQSHIWICQQLYSTLVELDSQLNIRPSVAKSWQLSEDRSTYVFTLRDNIYFNGNELHIVGNDKGVFRRKLVADDLVYSLNRLTDSKLASPGSWIMSGVLQDETGRLTGVKALNDTTIEIRLKSPNPAFLSLLAMPYCSIVPKEVVEAYGHDFRSHPCGTGPFKLAFWKEGVRLVLHKNEYYFEKDRNGLRLPYLDAVSVSFINDKQSAFIEFLKGNLDMLSGLDPSFKDELLTPSGNLQPRHQGRFVLQLQPYLNTEYLGILVDSAAQVMNGSPLLDLRIRQALSYGFDRDRMMTYLRNNVGTPGVYGMVPPGLPSFLPDSSIGYHYDPSKSKRLLADAGYLTCSSNATPWLWRAAPQISWAGCSTRWTKAVM
ncbi:MAG: ABC transporter substrate-binding protein [Bacteroidota bacterium]